MSIVTLDGVELPKSKFGTRISKPNIYGLDTLEVRQCRIIPEHDLRSTFRTFQHNTYGLAKRRGWKLSIRKVEGSQYGLEPGVPGIGVWRVE